MFTRTFAGRSLIACAAMSSAMALAAFGPPSGRPPIGALERYDPKAYDFTFEVTLGTQVQQFATDRRAYNLNDAPIVMPLIEQGTFSRISADTVRGRLWLHGNEDMALADRFRVDADQVHHTSNAVLTVARFSGQTLRWNVGYRVQSWSSRLNENFAQDITWPKEWPDEVKDGLSPQLFIESDNERLKEIVENITNGRIRLVSPYLASKELVRWCINNVRVSGNCERRGLHETLLGLDVKGALETLDKGIGTSADLVCVCVAVLRAAGIPARPVIGAEEDENDKTRFVVWAELYMPECGWIPFDPDEMRGKSIRSLDVRQAWPEWGTMDDLNDRIPLAYNFVPVALVENPLYPAVWGWDPRPGTDPGSDQVIHMMIISRGKGEEDPK